MKKLALYVFSMIFLLAFSSASPIFGQDAQVAPAAVATTVANPDYSNNPVAYPNGANLNPVASLLELSPDGKQISVVVFPTRTCLGETKVVGYLQLNGANVYTARVQLNGVSISDPGGTLLDFGSFNSGHNPRRIAGTLTYPTGGVFPPGKYQLAIHGDVQFGGEAGCAIGTSGSPMTYFESPTLLVGSSMLTLMGGNIRVTPFQDTGSVLMSAPSVDFTSTSVSFVGLPFPQAFAGSPVQYHVLDLVAGTSFVLTP